LREIDTESVAKDQKIDKPTGDIGIFRVKVNPDNTVAGEFEKVSFSKTKAEIERQIVDRFINSMNSFSREEPFLLSNPQSNDENDFDFTVNFQGRKTFLELMEIAPLNGPYDKAPSMYKPFDFANAIFQGILKKAKHYPRKMTSELFLLLYVTHWTFILSDITKFCLRYWCSHEKMPFNAIFFYQPIDEKEGTPGWIYPYPPDLMPDATPERFKDTVAINLDPGGYSVWHENER